MPLRIDDPNFPKRLINLLQSRGTNPETPKEVPFAGLVITLPGELLLERAARPVGWGILSVLEPANPAAGASATIVVPDGEIWELYSLRFELIAGAAAGMREIILAFDSGDAAQTFVEVITTFEQGPNITEAYSFARGIPQAIDTSISRTQTSLPNNLILRSGWRIRIVVNNIQAADQLNDINVLRTAS